MSPVFRHGSLRLYLLRLLDEEPRHGYEVIRLLRDRFMGVYSPSPGTIYPRLARLEEEGLVTHDEVDGRKVYRITEAGREELRSRSDELDELEEELSASVSDIVREVREDVRQTVRSLREELTWAARESRRTARDISAEAREQARQARDEAKEQAKGTRDEAKEEARQAREQARAGQAREDPWVEATDEPGPDQPGAAATSGAAGAAGTAGTSDAAGAAGASDAAGAAGTSDAGAAGAGEAPGQDAARRVREHARWLREEAQRVREESAGAAGTSGFRDRIREEAAARFTGGEQNWEGWDSQGWTGRPSWTDWPGRRGRRGWTGALDFGTLKDLERVAVQFTADLRKLAMQSTAAGENVIADLRTILEEALERVKTEIFGAGPEAGGEQASAQHEGDEPEAPAAPGADTRDSPA